MYKVVGEQIFDVDAGEKIHAEEFFYRCVEENCATIVRNDANISWHELWNETCRRDETFLERFYAYAHFRHEGYFPKRGDVAGVHYLLYDSDEYHDHAPFGVVLTNLHEPTMKELHGMVRVMTSMKKDFALGKVIIPTDLNNDPKRFMEAEMKLFKVSRSSQK